MAAIRLHGNVLPNADNEEVPWNYFLWSSTRKCCNKHNEQDLQNQNPQSPRGQILGKHTEAITAAITSGLTGHRGSYKTWPWFANIKQFFSLCVHAHQFLSCSSQLLPIFSDESTQQKHHSSNGFKLCHIFISPALWKRAAGAKQKTQIVLSFSNDLSLSLFRMLWQRGRAQEAVRRPSHPTCMDSLQQSDPATMMLSSVKTQQTQVGRTGARGRGESKRDAAHPDKATYE